MRGSRVWLPSEPGVSEAFVQAEVVGERPDGSLRVRLPAAGQAAERIVRLGADAFPADEAQSSADEPAPSDLCMCADAAACARIAALYTLSLRARSPILHVARP